MNPWILLISREGYCACQDNADVLNLIEGKGGLLIMLDDATTGVKQTDLQYTTKVIQARHACSSKLVAWFLHVILMEHLASNNFDSESE